MEKKVIFLFLPGRFSFFRNKTVTIGEAVTLLKLNRDPLSAPAKLAEGLCEIDITATGKR